MRSPVTVVTGVVTGRVTGSVTPAVVTGRGASTRLTPAVVTGRGRVPETASKMARLCHPALPAVVTGRC